MQESIPEELKSHLETSVPVPAANLTDDHEAVQAQQLKKLSAKYVVDLVVDDKVGEAQQLKELSAGDIVDRVADNEAELPPTKKHKLDYKRIIMGEELSDMEINYAQQLLKANHPKFNGFQSTLELEKLFSLRIAYTLFTVQPDTTGFWLRQLIASKEK